MVLFMVFCSLFEVFRNGFFVFLNVVGIFSVVDCRCERWVVIVVVLYWLVFIVWCSMFEW